MPELTRKIALKETDKIMKNITQIKTEIIELNKQISALKSSLKDLFTKSLNDLLTENKGKVDKIKIGVNNHEFNDGDDTYFSIYYDDLTLYYSDELGNEYEVDGYEKSKNVEASKLREAFVELFESFDVEDFYETVYGNEYEEIVIKGKR
jgi:chromosomal replication initiation ATPase DnaA